MGKTLSILDKDYLHDRFFADLFSIPWVHHKLLMDKCQNNPQKAFFFVHQTATNGWNPTIDELEQLEKRLNKGDN